VEVDGKGHRGAGASIPGASQRVADFAGFMIERG
jgi:hypothetical protein